MQHSNYQYVTWDAYNTQPVLLNVAVKQEVESKQMQNASPPSIAILSTSGDNLETGILAHKEYPE
jgi:hypothetical protein